MSSYYLDAFLPTHYCPISVNSPDADVVLRSSDNVDFLIHKKNLEFLSGGFETRTGPNEFVQLTESSDTLELLFRFTYPRRFPSLKSLQLEPLMLLADAAEKYEVFALIYACDLRLRYVVASYFIKTRTYLMNFTFRDFLQTHPMRILEFAVKHDNKELIQELAPQLVHVTLSELVNILPDHIFKPWVGGSRFYSSRLLTCIAESLSRALLA